MVFRPYFEVTDFHVNVYTITLSQELEYNTEVVSLKATQRKCVLYCTSGCRFSGPD